MSKFEFNELAFQQLASNYYPGSATVGYAIIGLSAWAKHDGWLSQTDATEHLYGSSGRGSSRAAKLLGHLADLGILERRKTGRATYYRAPIELYYTALRHPRFDQHTHEQELGFIADGSRPHPREMK